MRKVELHNHLRYDKKITNLFRPKYENIMFKSYSNVLSGYHSCWAALYRTFKLESLQKENIRMKLETLMIINIVVLCALLIAITFSVIKGKEVYDKCNSITEQLNKIPSPSKLIKPPESGKWFWQSGEHKI